MDAQAPLSRPVSVRLFALCVGLCCHITFLFAVGSMMVGIYTGLLSGRGSLGGWMAFDADILLVLQFPLVHSWLLSRQGRSLMLRLSPKVIASDMTVTWFALIASIQLLLMFMLWTPSGIVVFSFEGWARNVSLFLYTASWIFLFWTMVDADLSLQSGSKGWMAVVRNRRPEYREFPQHGTFRVCRQPIYLAFALILWTAPVWTLDRAAFAAIWTIYCILGPRWKEARCEQYYGDRFRTYQQRVPYFLPLSLVPQAMKRLRIGERRGSA